MIQEIQLKKIGRVLSDLKPGQLGKPLDFGLCFGPLPSLGIGLSVTVREGGGLILQS